MKRLIQRWLAGSEGVTSVEYAVLLALILLVCFSAIASLGNPTFSGFKQVIAKGGFGPPAP